MGMTGHGVGNASASATNAILLTVLQDVFSRLTTIVGGYYLGTSLTPEAKTYRLLADVLNDAAIISDTLSPYLAFVTLSTQYPFVRPGASSSLRVVALCLSGAFRALCGAVAGGSKAALTVHFATDGERPGDVGDLSAKDGSKETVLALLGMLCGSVVVHYVHSAQATYAVLFALVFFHLAFNYMAVRVISMRYFNRQRASIAWQKYRSSFDAQGKPASKAEVPGYIAVSRREEIFTDASWIDCGSAPPARVALGVPFALLRQPCSAMWRSLRFSTFSQTKSTFYP
ncbi:vitamin B6 photo-protection and homoeostasis-domain-containing protein [Dichomitus squalens]|uniref:Vitamin B6 photo-protection and homoeostasis-domain-containing protein n=1 Tax=Dichomitus squalens TaxID=114155 RepID=A0A4Q9P9P1_9APHY|nr:vitamin B6 photo-protection and homoeostasis-domain-containing protein [Dichomitus squalens]